MPVQEMPARMCRIEGERDGAEGMTGAHAAET